MKTSRTIIVAVIAATLCGGLLLTTTFAQPRAIPAGTKVAICDIIDVMNNYQKSKDLTKRLADRRQAAQAEDQRKAQAIKDAENVLKDLKEGSVEYEKRLDDLQRMSIEQQAFRQFEEALAARQHHRLMREMYQEILAMVGTVAKEQGIQIVLFDRNHLPETRSSAELMQVMADQKVLYANPSVDLTEVVKNRLNAQYKGQR